MKKITQKVFTTLLLLVAVMGFSQVKVSGVVLDAETNQPLPGANIVVKGLKSGSVTDFDGKFTVDSKDAKGELVVSYIGFVTKTVSFSGTGKQVNVGKIALSPDASQLDEIVVVGSGILDIAKDRKTPVAVSTIKAAEIQEKLGNLEFPEILATTPSVYATKSGGGFGDSRINIRGFAQENIAVMINGVPVNDMENSKVYWSNWAGLSDVTSAMQVQRGLGSSKLAISSVGGTINVVTRSADAKQGGVISSTVGNDEYVKTQVSYNTGKMKNGFSASVLYSRTQGQGYVDGTKFEGHNYFIGLGYQLNEKHDFQFVFTGAPQWHNQRYSYIKLSDYIKYGNSSANEPNIKYNADWGYLGGSEFSWRKNFYHKPVMSLNWDYKIADNFKLTSVFYGSWGRGGGTGSIGSSAIVGQRTANGIVNFDKIVADNLASPTGQASRSAGATRRISINSHDWYGAVINLNAKLSEKFTLDFGIDARTYIGYHFQSVGDLLGSKSYLDNRDINNPNRTLYNTYSSDPSANPFLNIKNYEKIEYNNNGYVRWYGAFTQLEYSSENISAFFQGAVSQQGFKREDTFVYKTTDPLYETDYENILGGNAKGGVNLNINENMNVFANVGYYSKQPFFNAVYPNNLSKVNENLTNEKIFGAELGYGYRSAKFNANVNIYRTSWKDRYIRRSDTDAANVGGYYDFAGVTEIHQGVEVDAKLKVLDKLSLRTSISLGDWYYEGNSTEKRYTESNQQIGEGNTIYIDGVKVGDAAQTLATFGAEYEIIKGLKIDADYRFADNLYAFINPQNFKTENHKGSLELPNYGLLDAGVSYKWELGKDKKNSLNFRFNMNNVLNEVYIAEAQTNNHAKTLSDFGGNDANYQNYLNTSTYDGIDVSNTVYFGFGRTWNFSLAYKF